MIIRAGGIKWCIYLRAGYAGHEEGEEGWYVSKYISKYYIHVQYVDCETISWL